MKAKKVFLFFVLLIVSGSFFCKKPEIISFEDIYIKYQWRKTVVAVFNADNEFEKYIFDFETAEDCEKDSYLQFGYVYNLCNNSRIGYLLKIDSDSINYIPYDFDTIHLGFSRYIDYYDERSFVLRYDTIINGENKIIKQSYSAFDLN